ncbi:nitrogen permease regulator 2 [Xylariales sp. PMI_506]|nr:nitrogen permease regulator 2 [Xylariales sp. PMI_506]
MIQGIFYARFLPEEGTKIVAQSPPGCIVASGLSVISKPPLVDFDIIQQYIIPRKAFFNRFLTVNTPDGKYSILGYPVSIPHERYHRNEFIFNFGLVVEAECDFIPYERLVQRLAHTFAELEKQGGYLSSEGKVDGRRPIESLLEIVKEDLNNYGECMIPIDEANLINMKLFPFHPPPPPVRGWHVPVPKMKLAEIVDPTWDLTLQKLIPHIDGVNDVRRIAWLADVSLPLTQTALQHLLYYDTILLLDMFFFSGCYAPRPGIHDFIANRDGVVDECRGYVCLAPDVPSTAAAATAAGATSATSPARAGTNTPADTSNSATGHNDNIKNSTNAASASTPHGGAVGNVVSNYQLIKLMTTFCVGRSVMEWIKLHQDAGFDPLSRIDVRRFVQFGVIKGLLYRVHKYVVSKQYLALLATGQARPLRSGERRTTRTIGEGPHDGADEDGDGGNGDPLQQYKDGCHSFDQIITERNMTDAEIMEKLRGFQTPAGDLTVFYR